MNKTLKKKKIIETTGNRKPKKLRTPKATPASDRSQTSYAEDALNLLMKAVETIPIGITITDTQGLIVYTNSAEAKIHGYSRHELIGKNTRIFAPKERWRVIPFEKLRGLKAWHRESLNIRKNGEIFPVHLISVPVTDANGIPVGIITTCEDISERKKAEDKLSQRQKVIQAVYKIATTASRSFQQVCDEVISSLTKLLSTGYGMVMRFENGKSGVVSAVAVEKLGAKALASLNSSWKVPAHKRKELHKCHGPLRNLLNKPPYSSFGLKSLVCIPAIDTTRETVAAIVIMDERKREFTLDEIQLMKIFSSYIAFEIEKEAMEARLLNAKKMEVVGQLAGGVAHEVRNPLNAIMIFTETLTRDLENNSKYRPLIHHIRSQVDRLARIMKDLLNLGKPVEQSDLHSESLNAICLASVDLWKHSQAGGAPSVTVHQPRMNIRVMADSQRLQQVFFNLLDNAAKNSPEGSKIQLIINRPEANVCHVQIKDFGSGVPKENLARIFEPFFTTHGGGTGLGLSIVKHIVETHGGSVEIFNNEPPPGCTAEVRLPVLEKGK